MENLENVIIPLFSWSGEAFREIIATPCLSFFQIFERVVQMIL